MRLVVCVDRDDDLGRKAGVSGPVVGRAAALEAALKLGTADPEDSDTNAIFAAVQLRDEIEGAGEPAEVVVLTGSPKVGVLSDQRVADQFDHVLTRFPDATVHLVSDGAEDEYLFPILASRARIDGVHRVYIRQNASIESTYYTLVRALKDPKLRAKTVLPFAIVLLVLGIAAAGGVIAWGVIGLSVLLGVYLIFWTFDIDEAIIDSIRSASTGIRQGSVAFGFGLFSVGLVAVGFQVGYNAYVGHPAEIPLERVLLFLSGGLVWWIVGAVVWESGRALRRYFLRGRLPRSFPTATTSIVGLGFLVYGILYLVQYLEGFVPPSQLYIVVTTLLIGLSMILGAGLLSQYLKSRSAAPESSSAPS
jgi:putative membrane protein